MTTIDALHRHLDSHPSDHLARLVLADAVEEAGGCGAGWRAMVAIGFRLDKDADGDEFCFHNGGGESDGGPAPTESSLPLDWYESVRASLSRQWAVASTWWLYGRDRRDLEEAVVAAFSRLPPERQQQLLAGYREPQLESANGR